MTPAWLAVAIQSAPLIEWEPVKVPVYIVALGMLVVLLGKAALYGQQLRSGGGPVDNGADEREMLVLIRQGHDIQQRHLDELKLLRADLQESRNSSREMMAYLRRHDEEAAPMREKIHRLHDAYFEGDEG